MTIIYTYMGNKNSVIEKEIEIASLKNELAVLKNLLEQREYVNRQIPLELELSHLQIDNFVEELLADPNINIGYLPDAVERQIYRNVFNLMVGLLHKVINSTQIEFLGHHLNIKLSATQNT